MKSEPDIAAAAALIGDPARANMLCALMDGRALTATELAGVAGVGAPTASAHLGRLVDGGLLAVERQGRHRYYRLANHDVAQTLEALATLSHRTAPRTRPGPREPEMRRLRRCYDHFAGEIAVDMLAAWLERGWLTPADGEDGAYALTDAGSNGFDALGIDVAGAQKRRRAFARRCLDWSERRGHLGGALGAAVMTWAVDHAWVRRSDKSREMRITPLGARGFADAFGVQIGATPANVSKMETVKA